MLKYKVVWATQTGDILYFIFIPPFTAWIGTSGYPRCGVVREKMLVLRWDELYKAEPGMEFQCSSLPPPWHLHPPSLRSKKVFLFQSDCLRHWLSLCLYVFYSRIKSLNMISTEWQVWQKVKHRTDQAWRIFKKSVLYYRIISKISTNTKISKFSNWAPLCI